ncbi:hypothetical protein KIW84_014866 [Lathyrus oleraceus]|uniref:DUF7745 domain-containing protein n=1 Tax=Pisum sativum TaxID=3888 RepID=A0A9D5BP46_PEA|nr:hypothetical protein KIW84_014866 [Pisum sativum]
MKIGPYRGLGELPGPEDLSEVLGIPFPDIKPNIKTRGDVQGIPREFSERKAQESANAQRVKDEDLILALLADAYHTLHLCHEKKKGNFLRLEREKEELEVSLYKVTSKKSEIKINLNEKEKLLIEKDVELDKGKNKRKKVKECILGVEHHISNKNQHIKGWKRS